MVKCRNVRFLNTFPALPATTAADHAHIIDVGVTGNSYAMLQDAIVTLLYKICPATLTSFLSPNIKSFKLLVKYKEPGVNSPFIIMKRSNKVLVGVVTKHPNQDTLEFDNLARFTIKKDGSWEVTYTSYRDYFRYDWEGVWTGQTVLRKPWSNLNMQATPTSDPFNAFKLFPSQLADSILIEPLWDATRYEWTIAIIS